MQVSTFRDDALGTHDTTALRQALATGAVSAQELRDAALARAQDAHLLNAVVTWLESPQNLAGPYAGIPTFIKDNENIAGYPTRYGSRATPDKGVPDDSRWVSQWRELGFETLGKTTLPEFGLTATTECLLTGATRNPWGLDHSTGGSSGGSAALVAAGVVPIAHANDGGGSIRIPASCCGLVGLAPSRGRLVAPEAMDQMPVGRRHLRLEVVDVGREVDLVDRPCVADRVAVHLVELGVAHRAQREFETGIEQVVLLDRGLGGHGQVLVGFASGRGRTMDRSVDSGVQRGRRPAAYPRRRDGS